ncbi:HD domain-containing phosphohydrolase [Brevibacillus sp. SYSU BS000544]|uniref:HD domain-containing phosphohydrolase n=1 Tax=Brevibacillus sp. SYSU BS000544 TaxID=3416443 RepID=UPI003CE4866E
MPIVYKGEFIESVEMKKITVSLIGGGDGTEIIHHRIEKGAKWSLYPQDGWVALEHITILSGILKLQLEDCEQTLHPGDSFFGSPISKTYIFTAEEDTEFLYVSSRPVFHYYSQATKKMMDLAIAIEEKDGYTVDHCSRITQLSMMIGESMELDSHQLLRLNVSSFLHDVGKVRVPLSILQKPGKLSDEEWTIMKKHSTYGREILSETKIPLIMDAGLIVEQHHERFDGKGYPNGLSGGNICIEAAIISVADSYDAMTTDRPYKKGRTKAEALEEIQRCSGTMYNPDVVTMFLSLKDRIN